MRSIGDIKIPERDSYKIKSTTDYRMFRFIPGNRNVDHVEKIEKSIRNIGLLVSPIVVDKQYRILDGQNRFCACRNLRLPVYYVMQEGVGSDVIGQLNSSSKNWTGKDHIHYYAHGENEIVDYVYFEQLMKAFPWATQRVLSYAINGNSGFGIVGKLKTGELKCTEDQYNKATMILDYVSQFREYIDGIGGRKENYYFVVAFAFTDSNVDNDYLLQKFGKYFRTLDDVTSIRAAFEQVERKIYNYQLRQPREPISLQLDYERAMKAKRSRTNGKEI